MMRLGRIDRADQEGLLKLEHIVLRIREALVEVDDHAQG